MGRVSLLPKERTQTEEQQDRNAHNDPSVPPLFAIRFSSERWKPLYMDGLHPNINYTTNAQKSTTNNPHAIGTEGHGAAEFFHGLSPSTDCRIDFWARLEPSLVRIREKYHPGYHAFDTETAVLALGSTNPQKQSIRITYHVKSSTWTVYVGSPQQGIRLNATQSGMDDTDDGWMRIHCRITCGAALHDPNETSGKIQFFINGHTAGDQTFHKNKFPQHVLGDDPEQHPATSVSFAGHTELESPSLIGEESCLTHAPFPGSIGKVVLISTPASKSFLQTETQTHTENEVVSWQFQGNIASDTPESSVQLKEPPPWTILMERERKLLKGERHKLRTSEVDPMIQSTKPYNLVHTNVCDNRRGKQTCNQDTAVGTNTKTGQDIVQDIQNHSKTGFAKDEMAYKTTSPCQHNANGNVLDPNEYDDDDTRPETAEEERHVVLSTSSAIPSHKIQDKKHAADITDKPKLRTRLLTDGSCLNQSAQYLVHSEQEAQIHGKKALTTNIGKESKAQLQQQMKQDSQQYYRLGNEQIDEVHTLNVYQGTPTTTPWTLTTHMERVTRHPPTGELQLLGGDNRSMSMVRGWMASRFAALVQHPPRELLNMYGDDKASDDYTRRLLRRAVHDKHFQKQHPRFHTRIQQLVAHEDKHPPPGPEGDPRIRVEYEDHIYPHDPDISKQGKEQKSSNSTKTTNKISNWTVFFVVCLAIIIGATFLWQSSSRKKEVHRRSHTVQEPESRFS